MLWVQQCFWKEANEKDKDNFKAAVVWGFLILFFSNNWFIQFYIKLVGSQVCFYEVMRSGA